MVAQSSNSAPPGLIYPTQRGYIGNNPRDAAYQSMVGSATSQNNLNKAVVGGKYKSKKNNKKNKKYGGDTANTVQVPQMNVMYKPTGGPGLDPNSLIKQNASIGMQGAANSKYDNQATIKGGKRYYKRKSIKRKTYRKKVFKRKTYRKKY